MNYPWAEIGLAKRLGVAREHLRELRQKLAEGAHWVIDGKNVRWTQEGAEKAATALGAVLEKNAAEGQMVNGDEPIRAELRVTRRLVNPHLVAALREGQTQAEFVSVTSNVNFREGMTIQAEKSAGASVWRLVGRCPRFPGRW